MDIPFYPPYLANFFPHMMYIHKYTIHSNGFATAHLPMTDPYVCHIWFAIYHQYTPFMLAYIYTIHTDPMGMEVSINGESSLWMVYDGLFHGKSHRSKWMMTGGTTIPIYLIILPLFQWILHSPPLGQLDTVDTTCASSIDRTAASPTQGPPRLAAST